MYIEEKYLSFKNYHTYCRVVGKKTKQAPLVLLHGGPGSCHDYFEVLDELAELSERQIISYDQLGCGLSSIPSNPKFYCMETWIAELINLRQQLHLDEIHLLGQSFGGMLALAYLCDYQAQGVKSLILSSTLSSFSLWVQEQHRLIKELPTNMQAAIAQAETSLDFSHPAYLIANSEFMKRHVYEVTEQSPSVLKRPRKIGSLAYKTAWGPNEYHPNGNLKNFEYTHRLSELTLPTLITSGTDDLCTPLIAKTMYDQLPYAKWELFANCRHMPFVDNHSAYLQTLQTWLAMV
ncbi:proline iminopeptidase [Ligilactobacillus equi]|uniref:Proline iminopeptidase n=1 Tax=Ligilactobacillus equi DPC 6820 TaxID=1392007 RepID=V7HY79_9LACO|nr:proline iminopeptidase-family hydrolase [Ligilactobacillus equi]ETA74250.1 alpha/beta fold family hydrolase [Ligilactobacillus equi DPC 6820]